MEFERIQRRLQKLRVMAERGKGEEANNAKRILDRLLEKYEIDETETEQLEKFTVKYNPRLRTTALHLGNSLGIKMYRYTGTRRIIYLHCTHTEYNIYMTAFKQLEKLFKSKQSEMYRELEGFMYGFMDLTYPIQDEEPICPKCKAILEYDIIDRRYYCKCGYKGQKLRVRYVNQKGAAAGRESSGRLLT